jgi:hypothetical protein
MFMNSPNQPGNGTQADGELLPQRVAELAGELTEAQDESRRKRLARQISELARGGQGPASGMAYRAGAVWRGTQRGAGVAWNRVQSGAGQAARRARPARNKASRGAVAGRDAAARGVHAASGVAGRRARVSRTATWRGMRAAADWLTAQVVEMAPRVPIRDIATLRAQHPGLDAEQLADQLITGAARASAGVGAAIGAAAAVPFVPTMPMELGVETLALVAVELKLVAELHEVYGQQAPGNARTRMMAYLTSWAQRRGVRLTSSGIAMAVGSPVRRQLERRLLAKAGQSTLAFAPLLTGAAAGAMIDHRETRRLGNLIRDDLRKRAARALQPGEFLGQVIEPERTE